MLSFELSKEIEKDIFCLIPSVGQRKNSESPWESNLRTSDSTFRILHTARISNERIFSTSKL